MSEYTIKNLREEYEELLNKDPLEISSHTVIKILLTTGGPKIWIEIPDVGVAKLCGKKFCGEQIEVELSFSERREILRKYGIEDPGA